MKKNYLFPSAILFFTTFLLTIALFTLNTKESSAQTTDWAWAKSAGGTEYDNGTSIATDAGGNVFVTGLFYSASVTFGPTTLTNTNSGSADYFIVKYDADGNVIWAKSAGGPGGDSGAGLATDAAGNVLVVGNFDSQSLTFGAITLNNTYAGYVDIFVVKYDGGGNVLWAKSAGGLGSEYGTSLATDASGNAIVSGSYSSTSITFGSTTLTNSGANDVFVAKYDGSGNALWAKSAGGSGHDYGNCVSTDAGGNVLVTGTFISSSITFGPTTLTNVGGDDIFVVKYDSSGNVVWAIGEGDAIDDRAYGILADDNGNVIVTGGYWSSSITFGSTTLTNANTGYSDFFVAKYDGSGNVLWAQRAGGTQSDEGFGIATDASDNIIVSGTFNSSSITFGSTTLTSAGDDDAFFVKYDENGNVAWAENKGGSGYDYGGVICTDANGNLLVTGTFDSPSITFGATTLTQVGSGDVYVAKYGSAVGIDESPISSRRITIAPNPVSENSVIRFPFVAGNELQVTDLSGRVLFSKTFSAPVSNLQLPTLKFSSGMYLVKISDGKEMAKGKLVVASE